MNPELKRHLISAGITFLSGFALAIAPLINQLDFVNLTSAVLVGILFVGVRAGAKLAWELAIFPIIQNFLNRQSSSDQS